MMNTMPEGYTQDPMETVLQEGGPYHARGSLRSYLQRLEATGRGYSVKLLQQKHPQEFVEDYH
jgi:hypothetical protein